MLNILLWIAGIGVGGFVLLLIIAQVLYAVASPEEKAKMDADAATLGTPLKERLEQAAFGVDKLYEVRKFGLALDLNGQQIVLFNGKQAELLTRTVPFSTIRGAEIEIVSTNNTVTTGGRSLTGAAVGMTVAGPVGAVIGGQGSSTRSRVEETIHAVNLNIKVDDLLEPVLVVPLLKTDWAGLDQNSGKAIPAAKEWQSIVEAIADRQRASRATRFGSGRPHQTSS